jgi:hypothetical protein
VRVDESWGRMRWLYCSTGGTIYRGEDPLGPAARGGSSTRGCARVRPAARGRQQPAARVAPPQP